MALTPNKFLSICNEHDEWRDEAACSHTSPDLFFPIGTTGLALEQINTAKQVCSNCTVSGECLEFALMTNQDTGVWGGTSEEERRKLRKIWLVENGGRRIS